MNGELLPARIVERKTRALGLRKNRRGAMRSGAARLHIAYQPQPAHLTLRRRGNPPGAARSRLCERHAADRHVRQRQRRTRVRAPVGAASNGHAGGRDDMRPPNPAAPSSRILPGTPQWQFRRTPYLDILIDCSRGANYSTSSLAHAIEQSHRAFPDATLARVTAINFEARDIVAGPRSPRPAQRLCDSRCASSQPRRVVAGPLS